MSGPIVEVNCYRRQLKLNFPPGAGFIYRSSNNMVPSFQGPNAAGIFGFDGYWSSQDVIVAGDSNTREYVLWGAISARRSLSFFSTVKRGKLVALEMWQPNIPADGEPEKTIVLEGDDWRKLLIEYAEAAALEMNAIRHDVSKNYSGYCTWYYYYAAVTQEELHENIAHLAAKSSIFPKGVVQIDDGYQPFQGDWLEQRDAWPTPLAESAKRISDAGMIPGIWTMPLLASTASRTFREHPEWFVRDDFGKPFTFPGWSPPPDNVWVCLDATRPEVKEHITHVFKTLHDMGFRYFKMDALGYSMPEGRYSDPDATPVSAFREGLMTVRKAVPDSILLGCCAPFMAVLGIVDHCRVSPDTRAVWKVKLENMPMNAEINSASISVREAYHATIGNWWRFDRFFRADPDVLIARQDRSEITLGEARVSAISGILTGVTITSDNLGTIDDDRLRILGRAAKLRLLNPIPEWQPEFWPYAFTGTVDGKKGVAFVNDSEEPITFRFEDYSLPAECVELLHPMGKVSDSITLAPHDAALVAEA